MIKKASVRGSFSHTRNGFYGEAFGSRNGLPVM